MKTFSFYLVNGIESKKRVTKIMPGSEPDQLIHGNAR